MLTLTEFVILAFAAARATRFVTEDSLADRPRELINNWFADKPTSKARTFWTMLLACLFCVGFWLSAATVAVYLAASGRWHDASVWVHLIEVWAVAGAQAWLNYWLATRDT